MDWIFIQHLEGSAAAAAAAADAGADVPLREAEVTRA